MKLLLLHGPAKAVSRKKLTEIKMDFNLNNIVVFEEGFSIQDMLGTLATMPLVDENRLIVLENPPEDLSYDLSAVSANLSLVLWFDYEVAEKKAILEYIKKNNGQILYFPESKEISVFPFLDHLAYGDKRAFIELEKLKSAGFDTQYLITMIFYLIRNLVVTPKGAQEFIKQKLEGQRRRFAKEDLTNLYKNILEIDFKIKSGMLEIPYAEFLLVNRFRS